MDTLQWASVKGEGSAWMARLSAPARRFRRASIEEGMNHEWTRITSIYETVSLILYNFRVFRAFRG